MSTLTQHYDEAYYAGHYDAFLKDERYVEAIAHFYKYTVFDGLDLAPSDRILDFGSGPGQLTRAVQADCFDPSEYIQGFLRQQQRRVYADVAEIPADTYRVVFSSHSLEHCLHPAEELKRMATYLVSRGLLVLILPRELVPGKPTASVDSNRHFYAWNFQLLTNLLTALDFEIVRQSVFHAPAGLRTFSRRLPMKTAVAWSYRVGRWVRNYPSLLTIARKIR